MGTATRLALVAASILALPSAEAGNYGVQPVRLELKTRSRSQLLAVTSHAKEPLRLELAAHAWVQQPDGSAKLAPTRAVSLFPSLLILQPGESKNVRIAVTAEPRDRELTYRVLVSELPGAKKPGEAVNFLVQMSIPIYHRPPKVQENPALEGVTLQKGKLSAALTNRGNVHFLGNVRAVGRDKKGAVVYEHKLDGVVVLAGVRRQLSLPLPADRCRLLSTLSIEAKGLPGPTFQAQLPGLAVDACAPP